MISLLALFVVTSFAEPYLSIEDPTSIVDSQNLLSQVDATLGQAPFDEAFTCEKEAPFLKSVKNCALQCSAGFCVAIGCSDDDTHYKKYAAGCGTENQGIYSDLGDLWEFNSQGFQSVNNNPIRLFLMDLQNFREQQGTIILTSIEPTEFTISSTGEKVPAFHLMGDFRHNESGFTEWFLITYSPELPLVAQPLRYRTNAFTPTSIYGETTWFRFLGFPSQGDN